MKIKPGVVLTGVRPEIAFVMPIVEHVFQAYGVEAVVTSCCDGTHSRTSLHYAGAAVDLRTRDLDPLIIPDVVAKLRDALTVDFDVVHEKTHIHLEWQPRSPETVR